MVVFEREHEFVMVTQHDHAKASADFAQKLPREWFATEQHRQDFLFAVLEHDRGWIDLDHTPFWNDGKKAPYTFMDFPLRPKLAYYIKGIDEVEGQNPFAAVLCSYHYTSFFDQAEKTEEIQGYLLHEEARQDRILSNLHIETPEQLKQIDFYFKLIQFCDNASLYVCLNEPGVRKEGEFAWYQHGFKQTFEPMQHQVIMPEWISKKEVRLSPFPLVEEAAVQFPLKCVKKEQIKEHGLAKAYTQAEVETREVRFVP